MRSYLTTLYALVCRWLLWAYVRLCLCSTSSKLILRRYLNYTDYVVQSNRYAITEDYGCSDVLASTILSLLFIGLCSILFPVISGFFYCRTPSCPHSSSESA